MLFFSGLWLESRVFSIENVKKHPICMIFRNFENFSEVTPKGVIHWTCWTCWIGWKWRFYTKSLKFWRFLGIVGCWTCWISHKKVVFSRELSQRLMTESVENRPKMGQYSHLKKHIRQKKTFFSRHVQKWNKNFQKIEFSNRRFIN